MLKTGHRVFSTCRGCYVYDSHTNGVIGITPSVSLILNDYLSLNRDELANSHPDLSRDELEKSIGFIEAAKQNSGLFQPLRKVNYYASLSPKEYHETLSSTLSELVLNVTDQCNQSCKYCSLTQDKRDNPTLSLPLMTWDVARKSLEYFLSITSNQHEISISFYGGEPLLNWQLIKKCLHLLNGSHVHRKIRIRLVTNATLLNQSILDTLIATDVHLQVSLDGPQHIHDAARVFGNDRGSYQRVFGQLAKIRVTNPDYFRDNVSLQCTFSMKNDILEVFRYFDEGLPSELLTNLGYVSGISEWNAVSAQEAERHEQRLDELIEMYLEAVKNGSPFGYDLFWCLMEDLVPLASRPLGPTPDPCWPNQVCVPGTRRLFVDPGGAFYPCEKLIQQGWAVGDYESGIEFSKVQAIFEAYAKVCQQRCQDCWAFRLCSCCYLNVMSKDQEQSAKQDAACLREREHIIRGLRRFVHIWENEPQQSHNDPNTLHWMVRNQDPD